MGPFLKFRGPFPFPRAPVASGSFFANDPPPGWPFPYPRAAAHLSLLADGESQQVVQATAVLELLHVVHAEPIDMGPQRARIAL